MKRTTYAVMFRGYSGKWYGIISIYTLKQARETFVDVSKTSTEVVLYRSRFGFGELEQIDEYHA